MRLPADRLVSSTAPSFTPSSCVRPQRWDGGYCVLLVAQKGSTGPNPTVCNMVNITEDGGEV